MQIEGRKKKEMKGDDGKVSCQEGRNAVSGSFSFGWQGDGKKEL